MKRCLIIYVSISLLCSTLLSAQTSDDADLAGAKAFAKEFSSQLLQKKDVSHLLNKYFVSKPKYFPYGFLEIVGKPDWGKELSDEMRRQTGMRLLNFLWVEALYISKATLEDDLRPENRFPSEIMPLIKSKPILSCLLANEVAIKFDSLSQFSTFLDALVPVTNALRKHLSLHQESWESYFRKWASQFSSISNYKSKCNGEDCLGLQEGTTIFTVDAFPFYLLIIQEEGKYKIAAIEVLTI
jgi:hypothetical protein